MTRYFRALRLRTAADRRVNAKMPVRCAVAANLQKAPAHCTPAAKTRKRLRTALSPQTREKRLRTVLSPQRRENACALRSRRKHAKSACTLCSRRKDAKTPAHCALAANTRKTPAHCALAANLQKAPAHRRVPFVRSSPCVIAPSRSPYFGHFAKALQNVSKVRCSLVWAIMNSSAETLAALAVRRLSVLFRLMRHGSAACCTWKMPAACRRNMHSNFSRYLRRAGVCISTVARRIFTAHAFAAYSISII